MPGGKFVIQYNYKVEVNSCVHMEGPKALCWW